MKKKRSKGFLLTETLVVSVLVLSTLIYVFMQFQTINRNYHVSFTYNTVNSLYNAGNIRKYILENSLLELKSDILASTPYIDLSTCPTRYLEETHYCTLLLQGMQVKKLIFTSNDLTSLKTFVENHKDFSEEMNQFILYTSTNQDGSNYRIFVEFDDGTFSSILVTI